MKILINGVPSSSVDLASIPSDNISKIQYYSQPPIQYSNMGLGAVINVVTKKQTGGSMMLNTLNAVTTGFGNDVASLKYNWGRSTLVSCIISTTAIIVTAVWMKRFPIHWKMDFIPK